MPVVPIRLCSRWILLATVALAATPAAAQAPAWQWGLQTTNPTPADATTAEGNAVATDAAGRVYVGGSFGDAVPGSPAASRRFGAVGSAGPGRGGFVAQATAAGQWAWLAPVVASGLSATGFTSAPVTGVAVAAAGGDVYAVGAAQGSSLRVGSLTLALPGTGEAVFVARFSSAGACQWLRVVETTDTRVALAADPSTGGVVLAGTYGRAVAFGAFALPAVPATGPNALFVARLGPTGQWLAAASATGSARIAADFALAVGPAGQAAVVGSHGSGTVHFGSTTRTATAPTDAAFFVAQLSPASQWQWAVGGSGSRLSAAAGAAYTHNGTLWVSGRALNGTLLGNTTLVAPTNPNFATFGGFVGQLSATGQWGAVSTIAPTSHGLAVLGPLSVDAAGNAVLLGGLRGYYGPLGTSVGDQLLSAGTGETVFFGALATPAGQLRYLASVPAPAVAGGLNPVATALDASGSLYVTGSLRGSLALGSSALQGTPASAPTVADGGDLFLGKLLNATVLAARPTAAAARVALSPNPAHGRAVLQLAAPAPTASRATVADALGRAVLTVAVAAGAASVPVDLTGLAPGVYLVRCGAAVGRLVVE